MAKPVLYSLTDVFSIPTSSRDVNGIYFMRTSDGFRLFRVADTPGKTFIPIDVSAVETDPTVPSHVKSITTTNISDWSNKFDANKVKSVSQINDFTLSQGNFKIENESFIGLGIYNSVLNFGQYSSGGYSQQLIVPFENGITSQALYLRTSTGLTWGTPIRMWSSNDFSQMNVNSWNNFVSTLNITEVAKPKVYAINSNHYYSSIYAAPLSNNSIYSLGTMVLYSNGYWYSESIGDRSAGAGVPTYRNDMHAGAVLSSTSNNVGQQIMFDEIGQIYARGGTGAWNRFWSDLDFGQKVISKLKSLFQSTFRARYIKLTASSVQGWNGGYISMTEFEVYSDFVNVALSKTVTGTNISSFNGQPASILVDGDTGGFSYFNNTNVLGEIVIDLGAEYDITHVIAHGYFDIRTKVSYSIDGTSYQLFTDIKGVAGGPNEAKSYSQLQKDIENSRVSYDWGNHATAGYLTSEISEWEENTYEYAVPYPHNGIGSKGIYTNGGYSSKTQIISTNSSVKDDVEHVIRWDNGTGDIDLEIPYATNFKDRIITISNRNSDSSIRYINLTGESVYHSLGLTIDKLTSAKFADSGSGGAFPDRFSSITIKSINSDGLHWVWVIVNSNGNQ